MFLCGGGFCYLLAKVINNSKQEHGSDWQKNFAWSEALFIGFIAFACVVKAFLSLSEILK